MSITKKQLLENFSAASSVRCTMIGGSAFEDWPEICKRAQEVGYIETKPGTLENKAECRFILRSQIERIRHGRFTVKGRRYVFSWSDKYSEGELSRLDIEDDSFVLAMFNGAKLVYTIEE